MRLKLWFALALAAVCCLAAFAQEQQRKMTPEEQAMMAAWQKFATPGDAHKALDSLVGTWDAKVSMWSTPGSQPMVSTGTSECKWILGNRYVQEDMSGTYMGMPFHGVGITGYDNAKKQYFNTWFDNFGTGVMTSTGTSADAKSMAFKTTTTNPMNGKDMPGESKLTVVDADHHTLEMWGPGRDGTMFKMMEVDYSRRK